MKGLFGNLWEVEADLRVISTNPIVNRRKAAVMGRGCAREAKQRIEGLEYLFARLLRKHGNRVMRLCRYRGVALASFPVKHHWKEEADPQLIRRSAHQLVALADKFGYTRVVLPRAGTGNGRLSWEDVRPILAEILDDRFTVITFPPRGGPCPAGQSARYRIVRETQRTFRTGDVERTVVPCSEGLTKDEAEARAEEHNKLAREGGALAFHVAQSMR